MSSVQIRNAIQIRVPKSSPLQLINKVRYNRKYKVVTIASAAQTQQSLPPLDGSYESVVGVSGFCNWVVPGHVMMGQYPYMNTAQCTTHEQGEKQLQEIIQQGVNTFVCLLNQLPAQEKMKIGGEEGFYPYKPAADLIAASLSEHPPLDVVEGLRNPQLDKYLPPRKKQPDNVWHPIELKYLHMPIGPIKGFNPDEITPVVGMVEELSKRVENGDVLYIHCSGGTGRASVMAACVLIKMFGMSIEEALQRTNRGIDSRSGVEASPRVRSSAQDDFVKAYVDAAKK